MEQTFPLPHHVEYCRSVLNRAGFEAYPVGGCVRDVLLGKTPSDWDVTTSAAPEQVAALFPRTASTGLRHGTVTVLTEDGPIEVTTFRRESPYSDGRHPDRVEFVSSLEEDLERRDLTVNAMALDGEGRIIDPFGGRKDLDGRLLRCVGRAEDRLAEDRLRLFRALRFAAQLDFTLHPELEAVLKAPPSTAGLAAERVKAEVEKTLLSPNPHWVGVMISSGLLEPWLGRCEPGDPARLAQLPATPLHRWAGLVALTGCAQLPQTLRLEHRLARPIRDGLGLLLNSLPDTPRLWRHALADRGEQACLAAGAMALVRGDPSALEQVEHTLASRPCLGVEQLAVSGGELARFGLSGPEIGQAQRRLLHHVLDHPQHNTPSALLALLREPNHP